MIVAERLGLAWDVRADPFDLGIPALAGLALRDNPRRAHLVVSRVLAKHIPVVPSEAFARAGELASLGGATDAVVLGFCETATGLGHAVAEALEAPYVHTTRRPDVEGFAFEEEHSHAASHRLAPLSVLSGDGPLVLVDDELTTGTTALNTIAALPRRSEYVVAALLDLRSDVARDAFEARAARLGARIRVVALLDGDLHLPLDVLDRARDLQRRLRARRDPVHPPRGSVRVHENRWPSDTQRGGRHGFFPADRAAFDRALSAIAVPVSRAVLVVGTEELMHLPNRLALELERAGHDVRVQSTTRSPVLPWDVEGYAVRKRLAFPSTEDPRRTSYLYNVDHVYDDIVVVTEDAVAQALPLAEALRPWASDTVHVVPV